MAKQFYSIVFFIIPLLLNAQLDFEGSHRISSDLLHKMEEKIHQGDYENITSVLVAQNGKVRYEKYFNTGGERC